MTKTVKMKERCGKIGEKYLFYTEIYPGGTSSKKANGYSKVQGRYSRRARHGFVSFGRITRATFMSDKEKKWKI